MPFMTNSRRRKNSFKKCSNKRDLVNWARFTPIIHLYTDVTGKIKGTSGLATTCHFLLKNFTFFSIFWDTFTS